MKPVTVLLVDDNSIFLRTLTRFLEEEGRDEVVVIGVAGSGEEALTQARDLRPQAILLDLRMPGMSGLEALPLLRKALPETAIIVLSIMDPDAYRGPALAAGADDFVCKAALDTDLLPAIRRLKKCHVPKFPSVT